MDMVRDKLNAAAYDLSVFEETHKRVGKENKKKSNIIKINAGKKAAGFRRKRNPVVITAVALSMAAVTAVSVWIVCNNVALNELNQEIAYKREELSHQANLEDEYQMRIDSKLTSSMIEDYASEKLGMTQLKNAQKKFISLSDGDVGQVIRDDGTNTVLDSLKKIFSTKEN